MDMIKVTNRGTGKVIYSVQLDNGNTVRREFNSGETREMPAEELERLTWAPGGRELIMNYLLVQDAATVNKISSKVEPEYWLDDAGVKKLLLTGPMDEFLDCLDFAPDGVHDLIKKYAVELPINDMQKRQAILDKLGYDVTKVLQHKAEAEAPDEDNKEPVIKDAAPQRRTNPGRRTSPKYNVVNRTGEE